MYDAEKYKELPEETRHEMKNIATIARTLIQHERKARHQVLLNKLVQRSFDLIKELHLKIIEQEAQYGKV